MSVMSLIQFVTVLMCIMGLINFISHSPEQSSENYMCSDAFKKSLLEPSGPCTQCLTQVSVA